MRQSLRGVVVSACSALLFAGCGGGGDSAPVALSYTVSGTVSGLGVGKQVTLLNNEGNPAVVASNGSFAFSTPVVRNSTYAVGVGTLPPGQSCRVNNGSGTALANINAVMVECSDNLYTLSIGDIAFSPGNVDGPYAVQPLRLYNSSNGSITLSAFGISGQDIDSFALLDAGSETTTGWPVCAAGLVIKPGDACDQAVTFRPRSDGVKVATVSIISNAAADKTISLTGTGLQPRVSVSPLGGVRFPDSKINTFYSVYGFPQPITISNPGTGVLLFNMSISGPQVSDFFLSGHPFSLPSAWCIQGNLAPPSFGTQYRYYLNAGQSCTQWVQWNRVNLIGVHAASVVIETNAGVNPEISITAVGVP